MKLAPWITAAAVLGVAAITPVAAQAAIASYDTADLITLRHSRAVAVGEAGLTASEPVWRSYRLEREPGTRRDHLIITYTKRYNSKHREVAVYTAPIAHGECMMVGDAGLNAEAWVSYRCLGEDDGETLLIR